MAKVEIKRVKTDGYEVVFGRHSLAEFSELLASVAYQHAKFFILVDENTLNQCLPQLISKIPLLENAEVIEIEEGEESKSAEVLSQVWQVLSELGAERSSVLINLGGGVVTDFGGFVAGTFKRGIRFFNIPTSLLAMVDASLGGKTGINHSGLKNEVGLFNNPDAVFVDPTFLETLPKPHLVSGFAEMVKHALIFSPGYWRELKEVSLLDLPSLDDSIYRSIEIKNQIVTSDPYETGRRKILNFGHTIGHALESYSHEGDSKSLLHGEAIAIGMVCEAFLSNKIHDLSIEELKDITSFIFSHFPKINLVSHSYHRLIELMKHDKKSHDQRLNFTLLSEIGDASFDHFTNADSVIDSLNYYDRWAG
jgi:3-dehydroquinate synthase